VEIFLTHSETTDRLINDTNTSNLKNSLSKQKGKKPPTYKNTIKLFFWCFADRASQYLCLSN